MNWITTIVTVSAALIAVGGLAVYAYGVRWRTAAEVNAANAAAWEATARRLDDEVKLLREEVAVLRAKVQDLQKHNMEAVLDVMARHEKQAADRFERTVGVLGQIRDKLGT